MKYRAREEGQGLSEYALLFAFIVIVLVVLVFVFGEQVRDTYKFLVDTFSAIFL